MYIYLRMVTLIVYHLKYSENTIYTKSSVTKVELRKVWKTIFGKNKLFFVQKFSPSFGTEECRHFLYSHRNMKEYCLI